VLSAHLVAHTHWDREWYHEFVRFRQRLVALIDELLDDPPGPNESFLLDGQAVILEDYLEVRPEREEELSSLLWSGRLEAGPWYVLADELIPGGEALTRNLLVGRRVLRRLHAEPPPVLYCPDSFGHPAALPAVAAGFGLPLIVLWRGFGSSRWPPTDTFQWRAPTGEAVVAFHLPPNGYELGSDLPADPTAARERWQHIRAVLEQRANTGTVLVQNGADHHARQLAQSEAAQALAVAAMTAGDSLRPSSLRGFGEDVLRQTRGRTLPQVRGELRDSYGYTWTLQGTFASRAAQKRRNAHAERLLVRDAEPWAAFARRLGATSRLPLLVAAWRTLLQCHPHDTLCGCSIDAVAAAMDQRLDDAVVQAAGIRDDALADLIGHDATAARIAPNDWHPLVLVRNRAPRPRSGVAIIEIKQWIAHVRVGAPSPVEPHPAPPPLPAALDGSPIQPLGRRVAHDLVESPRHYPDDDLVAVTRATVWVPEVPAYGLLAMPLDSNGAASGSPAEPANPVRAKGTTLENGIVRITVSRAGRVTLDSIGLRRRIDDLVRFEDRVDAGDLYTPSIRGVRAKAEFLDARLTREGPLLGELRLRWCLTEPRKSTRREPQGDVVVHLGLVADSPLIRLRVAGTNHARDHRLRIVIRTDVSRGDIWADAAFGPVRREPLRVPDDDLRMETPPPTAPLHRYVSLFAAKRGATLFSDGLAEYEASGDGELSVTLFRAVGELSRNDLPERPGHAGWPAPTPRAQSLGRFTAQVALLLHSARTDAVIDEIERAADDVLLPLEGRTIRSALAVPPPILGAELAGVGLAFSALKESEDGEWLVARCVNLLDTAVEGVWRFAVPPLEARYARLDETPLEPLQVADEGIPFRAGPRAIVTVLVR
jgi:alpha-mannosidase